MENFWFFSGFNYLVEGSANKFIKLNLELLEISNDDGFFLGEYLAFYHADSRAAATPDEISQSN